MHPPCPRPGAASRSPFAALLLVAPLALTFASPAAADPLFAFGSHVEEDHSFDDHSNGDLRGIDLSRADLTATDLRGANLKDALAIEGMLVDAVLAYASLWDASFEGADLTGADLTGANAKNAVFADAVLVDATLVGVNLKNADFSGAHLLGADLSSVAGGALAIFTGAYIDADTQLDAAIDDSAMWMVVGFCPTDPVSYWIDGDRDGAGDTCDGVVPLPEPASRALLAAGGALVAALGAIRGRARRRGAAR